MSNQDKKLDALLNAYVDGNLNEKMRKVFRSHLDSHPNIQSEVDQFERLNEQIRATFNDSVQVPISDKLERFVENYPELASTAKESDTSNLFDKLKQYFNVPHILVYASIMVMSLSLTYLLPDNLSGTQHISFYAQIERLALDAHQVYSAEKRHAVEVPASDKAHMMKWLSKRLSAEIGPPELDSLNFQLIGGRLLPSAGKRAAFYMYADKDDNRLTLYIRQNESSDHSSKLDCALDNPQASICHWQGDKMLYILIGAAGSSELKAVSSLAVKQLNK